MGNQVLCLDLDKSKIAMLNDGQVPIHEPGLSELIQRNVAAGRLRFTSDIEFSVGYGALQFIAVGTPPDEDGSADMQYVLAAAKNIGRYMTGFKVVINKSTVPVGTGDRVSEVLRAQLAERGSDATFSVVSNPEFLKEGAAVGDFMRPDRIVIGASDERAIGLMRELYAPFIRNHDRVIVMDVRSAELTKYAANAMLATRISFMNEMANLSDKLGADIEQVRLGIGSDPRIGFHFLYPGCGYGGSCFPKDLKVLQAVEDANEAQKEVLLNKIRDRFGSDLRGMRFALWGLAFKPNTDDMRAASSRVVIEGLWNMGATVVAYDPVAMDESRRIFGNDPRLAYATSPLGALDDADALVIVTEWKEFRAPDFDEIKNALKKKVIFDGRNLYQPATVRNHGIEYSAIGRR
jgi:UDPglucose 6-dehydrogenase